MCSWACSGPSALSVLVPLTFFPFSYSETQQLITPRFWFNYDSSEYLSRLSYGFFSYRTSFLISELEFNSIVCQLDQWSTSPLKQHISRHPNAGIVFSGSRALPSTWTCPTISTKGDTWILYNSLSSVWLSSSACSHFSQLEHRRHCHRCHQVCFRSATAQRPPYHKIEHRCGITYVVFVT